MAERVIVPCPNVQPLNNIAECRRLLPQSAASSFRPEDDRLLQAGSKHTHAQKRPADGPASAGEGASSSAAAAGSSTEHTATSAASASTSATTRAPQRANLFDQWKRVCDTGPLSLLRKLRHRRVRIVALRPHGAIGWIEGRLELFDRHLNLVVRHVTERYLESSEGDAEAQGGGRQDTRQPPRSGWQRRSSPLVLLRGESVVSVCELRSSNARPRTGPREAAEAAEATEATEAAEGAEATVASAATEGGVAPGVDAAEAEGEAFEDGEIEEEDSDGLEAEAGEAELQRQRLGDELFAIVSTVEPARAGKITGMLLEMGHDALIELLESRDAVLAKVREAVSVLQRHTGR